MIEAKHIGFYDPDAGRHSIEAKRAFIVRERHQASFALGGTNRRAGNRLATRLDTSRLCKSRLCKNEWQARCKKHENFGH
jgi:hypothetical protein